MEQHAAEQNELQQPDDAERTQAGRLNGHRTECGGTSVDRARHHGSGQRGERQSALAVRP